MEERRPKTLMSHDEAVAQNVLKLGEATDEEIKSLSDLDDEEINYLTILFTLADTIDLDVLKIFGNEFLRLRVSKGRLGRKEIVWISSGLELFAKAAGKVRSPKDIFAGF